MANTYVNRFCDLCNYFSHFWTQNEHRQWRHRLRRKFRGCCLGLSALVLKLPPGVPGCCLSLSIALGHGRLSLGLTSDQLTVASILPWSSGSVPRSRLGRPHAHHCLLHQTKFLETREKVLPWEYRSPRKRNSRPSSTPTILNAHSPQHAFL